MLIIFEGEESYNGHVLDSDDDEYLPESVMVASYFDDTGNLQFYFLLSNNNYQMFYILCILLGEVDENALDEDEESEIEDDDDEDEESEIEDDDDEDEESEIETQVMTAKDVASHVGKRW